MRRVLITKNKTEIGNKLQGLRLSSRNKFLELRGKEFVEKFHEIEIEISKESKELAKEFHEIKLKEGRVRADKQTEFMKINRSALVKEAYSKFKNYLSENGFQVMKICGCMDMKEQPYSYHGIEDEDIIKQYPTGYDGNIEVKGPYTDDLMQAQPQVRIEGIAGENFKGIIEREFVFVYKPSVTGDHCIHPDIYLNGYWFIWPFFTGGCGTLDTTGRGSISVTLHVRVQQNGLVYENEYEGTSGYPVVKEVDLVAPGDREGAIYYTEALQGKTWMRVFLEEGNLATIFVSCKVHVEIEHLCLVIVDLGSDDGFYFRVPRVEAGYFLPCPFPFRERGSLVKEEAIKQYVSEDILIRVLPPRIDREEE